MNSALDFGSWSGRPTTGSSTGGLTARPAADPLNSGLRISRSKRSVTMHLIPSSSFTEWTIGAPVWTARAASTFTGTMALLLATSITMASTMSTFASQPVSPTGFIETVATEHSTTSRKLRALEFWKIRRARSSRILTITDARIFWWFAPMARCCF